MAAAEAARVGEKEFEHAWALSGRGGDNFALWSEALRRLSDEDQLALNEYRLDGQAVLEQVLRSTERTRDAAIQQQWTVKWKGREIRIRDIAGRIIHWVNEFKRIGDLLMQHDTSCLAIPWAAVRAVLQVLTIEHEVSGVFLLGIERVASLIDKCLLYEHCFSPETTSGASQDTFDKALLSLYTVVLAFLASAKKFFGRSAGGRALQSIGECQKLEAMIDDIDWRDRQVYQLVFLCQNRTQSAIATRDHNSIDQITNWIEEMRKPVTRIDLQLADLALSQQGKRKGDILKWVSPLPYQQHFGQAFAGHIPGTGTWLLDHKKYLLWKTFHMSQILWLRGDPGTGKTKLAALVVNEFVAELQNTYASIGLAYFFCNRSEPERRDPDAVWRTLVKQLCSQSDDGFSLVKHEYEAQERIGFAVDSLDFRKCQEILLDLLTLFPHTVLVIDALDECDRSNRQRLLEALQELCSRRPGRVSIFVSSRNDGDIILELKDVPNHYIRPADNASDIEKFVQVELQKRDESKKLLRGKASQELKDLIGQELVRQAKGIFVYVAFSIEYLCTMSLESDIRDQLGRLPDGMDETYDVIYDMIQKQQSVARRAAETTITWIMSAYRPLTPDEMFAALVYAGIEEEWDLDILLEICRNLVVLDKEQNVLRFTHLSAVEYLQKKQFDEHRIHAFVSRTCMGILHCQEWALRKRLRKMQNQSLAEYALLYWPFHTQLCERDRSEDSQRQLRGFLGSEAAKDGPFLEWFTKCKKTVGDMSPADRDLVKISQFIGVLDGNPPSPLVLATTFALRSYLKYIFQHNQCLVNISNKAGQTLLMIAARMGHNDVVDILVEAGADIHRSIDSDFCLYANALQAAAIGGEISTVKILLRHGDIALDAPGGRYGNSVVAAAFYGHEEMVEELIRNGGKTRPGRGDVGDALHAAARSGNVSLVESLLDDGEDVNARAGRYETALACAVDKGSASMVSLLLERGAEVNMKAGIYGSPLHLAALWGYDRIAEILLDAGADPNSWDASARTPFHETVTKGRLLESTMELLLARGTNPYHLDDAGWSTHDEAMWRGCADIVEFLEKRGITPARDPPDCPLKDKSQPGLIKAALGEAFRDKEAGTSAWLEYALPIIRFSAFHLGLTAMAVRAAREWVVRWGWLCDGCRRNYEDESLHACKTCHSTNLCHACFRLRQKAKLSGEDELPRRTCDPGHEFEFVDVDGADGDLARTLEWLVEVHDELEGMGYVPKQPQLMLRFDRNRRTWAQEDHRVNGAA